MGLDFAPLPKTAHDCAVEATISVVSGKWKPILLYQMRGGAKLYSELHRVVQRSRSEKTIRCYYCPQMIQPNVQGPHKAIDPA